MLLEWLFTRYVMIERRHSSHLAQSHILLLVLAPLILVQVLAAQTSPELYSSFDSTTDGWRVSTNTATLTWQTSSGTPDGYLQGAGPGGTNVWYFVSPSTWTGDWSGHKVLKFDLSIPSRHYPEADQAPMVVLVGTNGQSMSWMASTPLWTWTHYEVSLSPAAFDVDPTKFSGIMAGVSELRILGEVASGDEIVGLDNVGVTAMPPTLHQTNLVSRFTDGTTQGWRPVDDVTLTVIEEGLPSFALKGDDWRDGRYWKAATPVAWAGDWRPYTMLNFDMCWAGQAASHTDVELVQIFGANGRVLSFYGSVAKGAWQHYTIPLEPGAFGVSAEVLEETLAHVSEMWIFGEFGEDRDISYFDNVILSRGSTPVQQTQNLVSRFDHSGEGWTGYDGAAVTWNVTNGISGGALMSVDAGNGWARFQSPDSWSGDWRSFHALRFMLRVEANQRAEYEAKVWIATWSGSNLSLTLPKPFHSWTPYTVDLKPETFGVTTNEFDAIMSDVACLWICGDFIGVSGTGDSTRLDNVMLLREIDVGLPSDRTSDFTSGAGGWRHGGWNTGSSDWTFTGQAPHVAEGGNPGGHLENTDSSDWTYWFSPEAWAGDWRGLESVAFDFNIIKGIEANLFGTRMLSICSPHGNLHADVSNMPVPEKWVRYEFPLTPSAFGASAADFDRVMRDVVALCIRSEWIYYDEIEGLDNFRLSKAPDAYWGWISGFYSGNDLEDETKTSKMADPDGDGLDNWSEYVACTIPTNRLDYLRLELLAATNGVTTLSFQTAKSRTYAVECTTDLTLPGSWFTVTNNIPGSDAKINILHRGGEGQNFYRLKIGLAQ